MKKASVPPTYCINVEKLLSRKRERCGHLHTGKSGKDHEAASGHPWVRETQASPACVRIPEFSTPSLTCWWWRGQGSWGSDLLGRRKAWSRTKLWPHFLAFLFFSFFFFFYNWCFLRFSSRKTGPGWASALSIVTKQRSNRGRGGSQWYLLTPQPSPLSRLYNSLRIYFFHRQKKICSVNWISGIDCDVDSFQQYYPHFTGEDTEDQWG